jgi:hypothetical protein
MLRDTAQDISSRRVVPTPWWVLEYGSYLSNNDLDSLLVIVE